MVISKTVLRWLTLVALVGLSFGVMVPAASAAPVGTEIPSCPFTITSAGNFFIKKNLTATGTCIKVNHSNVAIDMNGKTITGNGTGDGITDDGSSVEGVAISHGKIRNFNTGIDFFGTFFFWSHVITIDRVDSSDNKSSGIYIQGGDDSITFVRANRNGNRGIRINSGDNLFNFVEANDNKDAGIRGTSRNGISRVTANRNGDDGIRLTGLDNVVSNATANDNGKDGIAFDDDDDNRVSDSVANHNKFVGIDLKFSGNNTVTHVTANHNGTIGVVLACDGDGNAVRVSAHGNPTKDLSETGTCTNLLNNVGTGP